MRSARTDVMGVGLSWAAVSDPGLVRGTNEDSVLAEPGWYAVADGMGGHDAGEVASALTVETLRHRAAKGVETEESGIPQALDQAHRAVRAAAGGDRVIGSTVTGLALSAFAGRPTWLVWNVGDSRCYRVLGEAIEQITHDHTVVADLVASGALTDDEARRHPDRHVITRAVGADEAVRADYWMLAPVAGERFLLCSDGLTNEVSDAEIRDLIAAADSPRAAVIGLLSLALERGGHDNVSAVAVFNELAPVDGPDMDAELSDTAPRPATARAQPDAGPAAQAAGDAPPTSHHDAPHHDARLISEVPG